MIDIDYIMELLDWNNSIEKQKLGIKLAHNVKCINVFLQPGGPSYGKMSGKTVLKYCLKNQI